MKKTIKIILFILLVSIVLIILNTVLVKNEIININSFSEHLQNEEIIKSISIEPYSLSDDEIKLMIVAKDTENGLKTLEYTDSTGNIVKTINCNGKKKVSNG